MALDKELNSSISQSIAFLFSGFAARLAGLTVDVLSYLTALAEMKDKLFGGAPPSENTGSRALLLQRGHPLFRLLQSIGENKPIKQNVMPLG